MNEKTTFDYLFSFSDTVFGGVTVSVSRQKIPWENVHHQKSMVMRELLLLQASVIHLDLTKEYINDNKECRVREM